MRARLLSFCLTFAATCVLPASSAFASGCSNETLRNESNLNPATQLPYSTRLPDCRAYELVSTDTENRDAMADPEASHPDPVIVGADGNEVAWQDNPLAFYADPSNPVSTPVLASRRAGGWSQSDALTPPGYAPGSEHFTLVDGTPDLTGLGLVGESTEQSPPSSPLLPVDDVEYQAAEAEPYSTVATSVAVDYDEPSQGLTLSPDGSHAFLSTLAQLAGDTHATYAHQLYEWTKDRGLRVFAVNNAGNPLSACGAILGYSEIIIGANRIGVQGRYAVQGSNPVSHDGSRVFFTSPDPSAGLCPASTPSELYMRANDSATVEISKAPPGAAQCEPEGPPGVTECPAYFVGATPDGSKAFFVTKSQLTPDKANTHLDLYEYDVETGALTRLSVGSPGHDDADIQTHASMHGEPAGPQVLVSRDGSHVYFIGHGQLIPGKGTPGAPNLYLYANGRITFITTVTPTTSLPASFLTPDGSDLVFTENESNLTSYDSHGLPEIYRYDASRATLSCVSCDPNGAPPFSNNPAQLQLQPQMGVSGRGELRGPREDQRAISEDGSTIFFTSVDNLVPAATNHQPDVYEWHNGTISLISSGTSPYPDYLLGMSASGSDVFFMTRDQLVPQDGDQNLGVYDARVEGGFPSPSTPAPCASAETCRSAPATPPVALAPASVRLYGAGNVMPAAPEPGENPTAPKPLTNAQKFAKALKACAKKPKKQRARCKALAKKKYGPPKKVTSRRRR
jgi:hypothetical protein